MRGYFKKIICITIIIGCYIFFIGCSGNKNTVNKEVITSAYIEDAMKNIEVGDVTIPISFIKVNNDSNLYPENKIKLDQKNITNIFYMKQYDDYKFLVCLDKYDTLNIAYEYKGTITSLSQIEDWSDVVDSNLFTSKNSTINKIEAFNSICGHKGVRVDGILGATSKFVFYISMDGLEPSILLSTVVSSDLNEYDINNDGYNELISQLDNYMYIYDENTLYYATIEKVDSIKQIYFNDKSHLFEVIKSNGKVKYYTYDSNLKSLVLDYNK